MTDSFFPHPKCKEGDEFQLLVTNLSYSPYLGQLSIGRILRGSIHKNQNYTLIEKGEKKRNFKASSVQVFDVLDTTEVKEAHEGDIVLISGVDQVNIGDTITVQDNPEVLPRVEVEPPTVAIHVSVSTSPLSGQEGEYLTSRKLEEFLEESCKHNVALKYDATDD